MGRDISVLIEEGILMWCEGPAWADYLMQVQFVNAVVGALPVGVWLLRVKFTLSHITAGNEPFYCKNMYYKLRLQLCLKDCSNFKSVH